MKLLFATIITTLISCTLYAQNMVTSEILQRVFLIKYGSGTGTCFYVTIENKDYLITAKHLFPNLNADKSKVDFEILRDTGWLKTSAILLVHENVNIDIAVLDLGSNSLKENLFDIGSKDYFLSQECFFLGFPFGLKMQGGENNSGYPVPFIKKGIISAFVTDQSKLTQIFLDGHNNPGFSGGPVVIRNFDPNSKHKMKIIGVVSAYLNENKIIKTPIGDFVNGENSGIVVSYAFDHVFEIIKR